MSFFPLRIHQNRCPTGGAYRAPSDFLAGFKEAALQQEGDLGEGRGGGKD